MLHSTHTCLKNCRELRAPTSTWAMTLPVKREVRTPGANPTSRAYASSPANGGTVSTPPKSKATAVTVMCLPSHESLNYTTIYTSPGQQEATGGGAPAGGDHGDLGPVSHLAGPA